MCKKIFYYILIFTVGCRVYAQVQNVEDKVVERTISVDDPHYREDQFYFGLTHTILFNKPEGVRQNSISTGVQGGFLRDIPLDTNRRWAIAAGAGVQFINLRHNLLVQESSTYQYQVVDSYETNKQNVTFLEIPIEFRWRTSTMQSHKFNRIYFGLKYSYLINSQTTYVGDLGNIVVKNNNDLNNWNIGTYLAFGYNTWNLYIQYNFKNLYKKNTSFSNEFTMMNVGLIFYIL